MKAEINNLINKWINKYYKRNTYQVDFPAGIESWVHRCSNKTVLDVWQEVCLCGCLYKCMHLYLHVCMMSALVKINIFILFVHVCVCLGVGVCVCVCLMHQCVSGSSHSVLHQHGDRHWTHPSGDRCDETCSLLHSYNMPQQLTWRQFPKKNKVDRQVYIVFRMSAV